ncbi:MAG TPA: hypothetical protein PL033_19490 [Candidatus Brocadiia bacterium]|nr:hypothetical protein [Candidatus Brocadiia bacterium]
MRPTGCGVCAATGAIHRVRDFGALTMDQMRRFSCCFGAAIRAAVVVTLIFAALCRAADSGLAGDITKAKADAQRAAQVKEARLKALQPRLDEAVQACAKSGETLKQRNVEIAALPPGTPVPAPALAGRDAAGAEARRDVARREAIEEKIRQEVARAALPAKRLEYLEQRLAAAESLKSGRFPNFAPQQTAACAARAAELRAQLTQSRRKADDCEARRLAALKRARQAKTRKSESLLVISLSPSSIMPPEVIWLNVMVNCETDIAKSLAEQKRLIESGREIILDELDLCSSELAAWRKAASAPAGDSLLLTAAGTTGAEAAVSALKARTTQLEERALAESSAASDARTALQKAETGDAVITARCALEAAIAALDGSRALQAALGAAAGTGGDAAEYEKILAEVRKAASAGDSRGLASCGGALAKAGRDFKGNAQRFARATEMARGEADGVARRAGIPPAATEAQAKRADDPGPALQAGANATMMIEARIGAIAAILEAALVADPEYQAAKAEKTAALADKNLAAACNASLDAAAKARCAEAAAALMRVKLLGFRAEQAGRLAESAARMASECMNAASASAWRRTDYRAGWSTATLACKEIREHSWRIARRAAAAYSSPTEFAGSLPWLRICVTAAMLAAGFPALYFLGWLALGWVRDWERDAARSPGGPSDAVLTPPFARALAGILPVASAASVLAACLLAIWPDRGGFFGSVCVFILLWAPFSMLRGLASEIFTGTRRPPEGKFDAAGTFVSCARELIIAGYALAALGFVSLGYQDGPALRVLLWRLWNCAMVLAAWRFACRPSFVKRAAGSRGSPGNRLEAALRNALPCFILTAAAGAGCLFCLGFAVMAWLVLKTLAVTLGALIAAWAAAKATERFRDSTGRAAAPASLLIKVAAVAFICMLWVNGIALWLRPAGTPEPLRSVLEPFLNAVWRTADFSVRMGGRGATAALAIAGALIAVVLCARHFGRILDAILAQNGGRRRTGSVTISIMAHANAGETQGAERLEENK